MSFDEVRLPITVEKGATGGPGFNTTVLELSSGHEQRNQNWSVARGEWDIGYGIQSKADLALVLAFFYARRGKARGFRFRDWSDYEVTTQKQFGTGDGTDTTFQLSIPYTSGGVTYTRNISKPVASTVRVWVNSVELASSAFAVNESTGIVTFDTAPPDTHILEWTGEFDVPVRFDTDQLNVSMEIFNAGTIPTIPIVELRV